MDRQQIEAIKKETEIENNRIRLYGNNIFKDKRIAALIEEFKTYHLSIDDVILQAYFVGWEDRKENED